MLLVWVLSWSVSYLTLVELCFVEIMNVHVHVCISYLWTCIHFLGCSTVNCFPIILQVNLPTKITPRFGHSAIVFGVGEYFKVVVLFGGESNYYDCISETTLLLLCK